MDLNECIKKGYVKKTSKDINLINSLKEMSDIKEGAVNDANVTEENMLRIAIDVDEVLSDIMQPLLNYYNEKYDKSIKLTDIKSIGLHKYWHISIEETVKLVEDFFMEKFDETGPINGSIEGVKQLKELGHELFILSARPVNVKDKTIHWIKEVYGDVFTEMFFTDKFSNPNAPNKSDIMRENNLDILIDDDPNNCFDAAKNGFQAVLLNVDKKLHYTKCDEEHENVTKAHSWEEAVQKLPEITTIKN